MVKRTNPFAEFAAPSSTVAKRLKRVEKLARSNRPEVKSITFSSTGTITQGTAAVINLTAIAQGAGSNERVGDKITPKLIKCRGLSSVMLDHYLISGNLASTAPAIGNFTSAPGAFVLDAEEGTIFKELYHYRSYDGSYSATGSLPTKFQKKLTSYMKTMYNGTAGTSTVRNTIWYVVVNRTTTDVANSMSLRLYYTDN